jgi:hypothetical protein
VGSDSDETEGTGGEGRGGGGGSTDLFAEFHASPGLGEADETLEVAGRDGDGLVVGSGDRGSHREVMFLQHLGSCRSEARVTVSGELW